MQWLGIGQAVREGDAGGADEDEDDEEDEDFVFELDWNDLMGPNAEPQPAPPRTRAQRKQRGYKYENKAERPQNRERVVLSTQLVHTKCVHFHI